MLHSRHQYPVCHLWCCSHCLWRDGCTTSYWIFYLDSGEYPKKYVGSLKTDVYAFPLPLFIDITYSGQYFRHHDMLYSRHWHYWWILSWTSSNPYSLYSGRLNYIGISNRSSSDCVWSSSTYTILVASCMGRGNPRIPILCTRKGKHAVKERRKNEEMDYKQGQSGCVVVEREREKKERDKRDDDDDGYYYYWWVGGWMDDSKWYDVGWRGSFVIIVFMLWILSSTRPSGGNRYVSTRRYSQLSTSVFPSNDLFCQAQFENHVHCVVCSIEHSNVGFV